MRRPMSWLSGGTTGDLMLVQHRSGQQHAVRLARALGILLPWPGSLQFPGHFLPHKGGHWQLQLNLASRLYQRHGLGEKRQRFSSPEQILHEGTLQSFLQADIVTQWLFVLNEKFIARSRGKLRVSLLS